MENSAGESSSRSFSPCVVFKREKDLSLEEAFDILSDSANTVKTAVPPARPKAGEVYLFCPEGSAKAGMVC